MNWKEIWDELKEEPILQLLFLPITIPMFLAMLIISLFLKGESIPEEELKKIIEGDKNYI